MSKYLFIPVLLFTGIFLQSGCEKNDPSVTGKVEWYLLESYDNIDQTEAIALQSVQIADDPVIPYSEIISYNSREYLLKISSKAAEAIEALEHSVFGLPFAVVADDQVIYTGYFWPSYSSASCTWIVIDPLMISGKNELEIRLGYPGLLEGAVIPDERNNARILDIFRRDGKLIEK